MHVYAYKGATGTMRGIDFRTLPGSKSASHELGVLRVCNHELGINTPDSCFIHYKLLMLSTPSWMHQHPGKRA